jgi:hypothetical protein
VSCKAFHKIILELPYPDLSQRQWGSSIHHNGMSFFPAIVPEGTLLYHGDCTPERPIGPEWLAFEIQHAEIFAWMGSASCSNNRSALQVEWTLEQLSAGERGDRPPEPGWLHIYKANRPLKLLYIDGMAAAKCNLGPMDSQDFLLLGNFTHGNFTGNLTDGNLKDGNFLERERSKALCSLATEWGIEGFIRMEAGFEIIKCDFSESLDLLSHRKRPSPGSPTTLGDVSMFEYIREISNRYQGIDGSRVLLDYSSMISAFFYPTNFSNPDGESPLPRLLFSTPEQLARIKSDLGEVLLSPPPHPIIDWQGITDMIVKRYSERLQFMAADPSPASLLRAINNLLNLFVDYEDPSPDAIQICSTHYLHPAQPSTSQDHLIAAALETVTQRICTTLFAVRDILIKEEDLEPWQEEDHSPSSPSATATGLIRDLITWLDWAGWKECGPCGYDRVCFVAVFPFGATEDHFSPRCMNKTEVEERNSEYWFPDS